MKPGQSGPDVELTEGLLEFLTTLEQAGVRMAVATSASRKRARYVLEHFDLENRFSAIVSGEDVAHGKPDPEVYYSACRRIDADTSTALVIEDAVSGVMGAKAAGIRCLGIADAKRTQLLYRAGADYVVPDFRRYTRVARGEVGTSARKGDCGGEFETRCKAVWDVLRCAHCRQHQH